MDVRGRLRERRGVNRYVPLALMAFACGFAGRAFAQTSPQDTTDRSGTQAAPGTVAGTVTDIDGGAVAGARVTLNGAQVTRTDELGGYTFSGVAAGAFTLIVTADGFVTRTTTGEVKGDESVQVPSLMLGAASSTDVTVTSSMAEVGKAEVKVEETQRVLGALPNFFVAYDWHGPPLSQKQKLELSYKSVFDPITILVSEISAGVQEADNQFSGYGKGGNGFVKRFAANQANVAIGTFAGGYLFPLLLHQDPRYFYMGPEHGSIKKRFFYALSTSFITRGDNGKWQPNYSSVLGDLATGAAANAYYPATDRHGWTTVIDTGLVGAALEGVGNLVQEFVFKKITPHSPNYPNSPNYSSTPLAGQP